MLSVGSARSESQLVRAKLAKDREGSRRTAKRIDLGIAPADGGAPNHHSCCSCSSRAFAIFADFSRTAVLSAASALSESLLVHAKLAEDAKAREEKQTD
ncbi:hypothetical protein [Gemmatimonas sp.]|uniref:hypothetical protein n=1 Tax=Gemmatimonas sp. TaxID=1962908 RepID=UPI0035665E28